jgi:hypothetical protein
MAKQMNKTRSKDRPKAVRRPPTAPAETQAAVAATVAWTVATTMGFACNIVAIGAHLFAGANPGQPGPAMFRDMLLLAGVVTGLVVLSLLPVVYRLRRLPPPTGYAVFAVCVATAPIVALVARALR